MCSYRDQLYIYIYTHDNNIILSQLNMIETVKYIRSHKIKNHLHDR